MSNRLRWLSIIVGAALVALLIGDLALLGWVPILVVALVIGVTYAARGRQSDIDVVDARRMLLRGDADQAALLVVPLLAVRSSERRQTAAQLIVAAADAGATDPAIIDLLPRLSELAEPHRLARAMTRHGMALEAIEMLRPHVENHDAVAWTQLVAALGDARLHEQLTDAINTAGEHPTPAAILTAVRRLDDLDVLETILVALVERLGEYDPAVACLSIKTGRTDETLHDFVTYHGQSGSNESIFWTAWGGAVLGTPGAIEQLGQTIGRGAPAEVVVPALQMLPEIGQPEVLLAVASSALATIRGPWRPSLHFALAHALFAVGHIDDAAGQLFDVPRDVALSAVTTPPLAPAIRQSIRFDALVDHLADG